MKVHTMKLLKIVIICFDIQFVVNNRDSKIVILLPRAAIFLFPSCKRGYDVALVKGLVGFSEQQK